MKARRRIRGLGLVLLLGIVAWAIYRALVSLDSLETSPRANQILLPVLSLGLVVLTLGLAGVLIRNLVKLIVERKRGVLGAKLRSKLVFFFLALVLIPSIVLFYGSATVIKITVEAILRAPLELTQGRNFVDTWTDHFRLTTLRRARVLASEIEQGGYLTKRAPAELHELVERTRVQEDLEFARVVSAGRILAQSQGPGPFRQTPAEIEDVLTEEPAGEASLIDTEGLIVFAAVELGPAAGVGDTTRVLIALRVPPSIAQNLDSLDAADNNYRHFRTQRRQLVRLYVNLIALIFLATLFVATWIGFYVSRRITVPIQEVSAATREISAGNLGVRVRTEVGDEMATLVDSFNEMAGELQENREVITRSTAELRHSNQALDERRRYIETLLASLSTGVISLDPSGRVSTANPAVRSILGVDVRIGDDIRHTFRNIGLDRLNRLLDEAAEVGHESVRRDLELSGNEATLHLSVQISVLAGRSGESLGTLMMLEDLSDLLRAQRALAWQEVARRIAHEIKNPLTPIQLAAQRLRKKYLGNADDLGQVLLESTNSIEREVGGLKQLVDEFSRFARMPEVNPQPVEFSRLIDSALSLYQGLPEIRWSVKLDPEIGWVRIDAQQIHRALINLIDNAVAAVQGQGTLTLQTRAQGEILRIELADSGPGIPPGDRDRMFVPYFSTKDRGTGLGLAIVHKIVTDHGGTIRIDDNLPTGARFVIELPVLGDVAARG